MSVEDDAEQKKKYWEKPDWKPVSYGNKDMNKWYRDFLRRRDEGMSLEFHDIPYDDIPEAKTDLGDKLP